MTNRAGRRGRWVRVATEAFAVLISILVAFSIDAWWDERGRSKDAAILLAGLELEIEHAIGDLRPVAAFPLRVVDAAARWREVTLDTPVDTLGNLVHRLGAYLDQSIELPSAQALLSTGMIASIDDPELRTWISAWPGRLATFDRQSAAVSDFARGGVLNYFADQRLSFESVPRNLLPGDEGVQPARDSVLLRSLVSDPGLRTVFVKGARMNALLVQNAERLQAYLTEGLALVQAARSR
jgi:hypothetical protein